MRFPAPMNCRMISVSKSNPSLLADSGSSRSTSTR